MASITAQDVKALRDATGAGMMDAKRALTEADGDAEAAARLLRQKGLTKVATLESRDNTQGCVAIASNEDAVAMVQLKSETDFSGKAEDFVVVANDIAEAVLERGEDAVSDFSDRIDDLKLAKRENITLGTVVRYERADGTLLDSYLHTQDGRGVNGVLVEVRNTDAKTAHDLCLHVAFAKPSALVRDEVDAEQAAKARVGFEELTRKEGKPEQAIAAIVEGRMNSWYGERVLPEQGWMGEKETVQSKLGDGEILRYSQAVVGG